MEEKNVFLYCNPLLVRTKIMCIICTSIFTQCSIFLYVLTIYPYFLNFYICISASRLKRTWGPWAMQAECAPALRLSRPRVWPVAMRLGGNRDGTVPPPSALVSLRLDPAVRLRPLCEMAADGGGWTRGATGVAETMPWATGSGFVPTVCSEHPSSTSRTTLLFSLKKPIHAFSFPAASLTEPLAVEDSAFKTVMKLSMYPSPPRIRAKHFK